MKTITRQIDLYTIDELSEEAREKARSKYVENNNYMFLSYEMAEKLHELLEENNIKDQNDTSKAGTKKTEVLYSLSYNQGDGAMFEGSYEWKRYIVHIKHSGRYYHSNCKTIEIVNAEDGEYNDTEAEEFEKIYQDICGQLETHGYAFIEYEDSMEHFVEDCEANDWNFLEDGTMVNY